jgi:hypothetical protein
MDQRFSFHLRGGQSLIPEQFIKVCGGEVALKSVFIQVLRFSVC